MTLPAPFSQYRFITPLLISVSIITTLVLMLFGMGNHIMLWFNWASAGILSLIIWNSISRFNLQGGSELKAFGISWPLITAGFQFSYCYFPATESYYKTAPQVIAMMLMISVTMSLWQRRQSTLKCLLLGFIIGLISSVVPHAILWLLLFPIACYYMRCWSARNMLSALTGAAFAIWIAYCSHYLLEASSEANQMLHAYAAIVRDEDYVTPFLNLGLWQWMYMGITLLLLVVYSISGLLLGAGQSVRTSSSIQMISVFSLVYLFLMAFDVSHIFSNLCFFSLFISLQLTIHQANLRNRLHDWWIIVVIIIYNSLCFLPIYI